MTEEAQAALDGDPNIVVWATVDSGKFLMVVTRNEDNPTETAMLRVSLKETDEEILNEQVPLAWGAIFGPDVDDVRQWQESTLTAVDAWIEAHPVRFIEPVEVPTITLRTYLALCAMRETGCSPLVALEAASSTAIEHPEWNMDERRTFAEWEARA